MPTIAQAQLYLLAFTRIMAVMAYVPVFGGRPVPTPVKIGLGGMLSFFLAPLQSLPAPQAELSILPFAAGIAREFFIGLLSGFAVALTFAAVQTAGELMSNSIGLSAGRVLNPTLNEPSSPISDLTYAVAVLLFLVLDGHHQVIAAIDRSFQLLPLNQPIPAGLSFGNLLRLSAQLLATGVQMALPVVGSMLIADFAMGLLARVSPQIPVFFLGLPLKVGVGIVAVSITMALLLPALRTLVGEVGTRMLGLIQG
jgi:flagellar biosynthetic protein FliR